MLSLGIKHSTLDLMREAQKWDMYVCHISYMMSAQLLSPQNS